MRNNNFVGNAARNDILRHSIRQAKKHGREWSLSEDSFDVFSKSACYYCGDPPSNVGKKNDGIWMYSGLDRVDNSKGYIDGNVVACCKRCNGWKHAAHVEDFLAHARKIVKNLEKQNARPSGT